MTDAAALSVRVKVCGITRRDDALRACELEAFALGFVFWPGSPRYVEPDEAARIAEQIPPTVTPVGVFVDQPAEEVGRIVGLAGLRAVQLHGREAAPYWSRLAQDVIKIKAVGVAGAEALDAVRALPPTVTPLLDAHDPIRHGGTGRPIDWTIAAAAAACRPIYLSGGLRADNVGEAMAAVRPYVLDVSSGVESRPGIKDEEKLRAFFAAVDAAATRIEK